MAAPRRPLNPALRERVEASRISKARIALIGGWPHYTTFYEVLRASTVAATPTTVARLQRVAECVGFPLDDIFLDDSTPGAR